MAPRRVFGRRTALFHPLSATHRRRSALRATSEPSRSRGCCGSVWAICPRLREASSWPLGGVSARHRGLRPHSSAAIVSDLQCWGLTVAITCLETGLLVYMLSLLTCSVRSPPTKGLKRHRRGGDRPRLLGCPQVGNGVGHSRARVHASEVRLLVCLSAYLLTTVLTCMFRRFRTGRRL